MTSSLCGAEFLVTSRVCRGIGLPAELLTKQKPTSERCTRCALAPRLLLESGATMAQSPHEQGDAVGQEIQRVESEGNVLVYAASPAHRRRARMRR